MSMLRNLRKQNSVHRTNAMLMHSKKLHLTNLILGELSDLSAGFRSLTHSMQYNEIFDTVLKNIG